MRRDIDTALADMDDLLELAELAEGKDIQNRTVASLYIRAMIRGNDALCFKYLGERPGRHDNATDYFKRLYQNGHLDDALSRYRNPMGDVLRKKADMQYKSTEISDTDLEKMRKRVTRFIDNAVRPHTG